MGLAGSRPQEAADDEREDRHDDELVEAEPVHALLHHLVLELGRRRGRGVVSLGGRAAVAGRGLALRAISVARMSRSAVRLMVKATRSSYFLRSSVSSDWIFSGG